MLVQIATLDQLRAERRIERDARRRLELERRQQMARGDQREVMLVAAAQISASAIAMFAWFRDGENATQQEPRTMLPPGPTTCAANERPNETSTD
jgi:hypothetical protein